MCVFTLHRYDLCHADSLENSSYCTQVSSSFDVGLGSDSVYLKLGLMQLTGTAAKAMCISVVRRATSPPSEKDGL